MSTERTTSQLSDEWKRLLDEASETVSDGPDDDPPRSDVNDAALTHLVESKENVEGVRDELEQNVDKLESPIERQHAELPAGETF